MKKILILSLMFLGCFGYEITVNSTQKIQLAKHSSFSRDEREQVVVDSDRHLMWQDNSTAKSSLKNWYQAHDFCKKLNLAGFNDWTLPTIYQLESLADFSRFSPAIKKEFKYVESKFYWSSTPYKDNPDITDEKDVKRSYSNRINNEKIHETNAWSVNFMYGSSENRNRKSSKRNIRCVREIR